MNEVEITYCLVTELAKLVVRSDEKKQTIQEGVQRLLSAHGHAFAGSEQLEKKLDEENSFFPFFEQLFGKSEEPYYGPFIPGDTSTDSTGAGFLVHIFKGEQDIVPMERDKISITAKQYYRLFHTLRHDLKRLECAPDLNTWLHLLQRYTKWIPAGSHLPHVSLYDYTRLKMAFTACLAEKKLDELSKDDNSPAVALCALELGGRENFLSKLRVDSNIDVFKGSLYYLQMLRENLVRDLLQAFDLPYYNCLYQGGERAILLVPAQMQNRWQEKQAAMEQFFLQHYSGTLSIVSDFLPLTWNDINGSNFTSCWNTVWQRTAEKKQQVFSGKFGQESDAMENFFGPVTDDCDNWNKMKDNCRKLGQQLTKARWCSIMPAKSKKLEKVSHWQQTMAFFQEEISLVSKKPEPKKDMEIYRFGNSDFACPQGKGFRFSETLPYLVAEYPMAERPGSHWAIINITVDKVEIECAMWDFLTTYEYLNDFFRTYLASLLREKKYRKYTYMLYTANHDVTIVCSPQIALTLVNQIHQKFSCFTGGKYTISGRIAVCPVEHSLQRALFQERKLFALQGKLRNRVMVMEENVSWNLLESLTRSQDKLATIAKLKGKRFLFPLWGMTERYRMMENNSKKDIQLWRHMVYYYLMRLGITDNLEVERGPVHLALAIQWNQLMSQD